MYSMSLKAPRRYSQGRNFGVTREQDTTAYIAPRRTYAPYENRPKNGQYKGSKNMVWTSKEYRSSDANKSRKSDAYVSKNSAVSGTKCNMPNKLKKNVEPSISSIIGTRSRRLQDNDNPKSKEFVCKYWKSGNCKKGEQCRFLHSWCCLPGLVAVAELEGHKKEIKGIALPQGSDKLFTASSDGTVRIWDCKTGQCVHINNLQGEAGSLISEGSWAFLGLQNEVKAFNVQTNKEVHLSGPVGQVHAMTVGKDMLFAGTSSGNISVWRATETESEPFKYVTSLEGHTGEVVCFVVGGQQLYSGSKDKTIKVWDLNTLQCRATLRQHNDTVTSLLCWDQFLLSSSLDGTIKVWGCSEDGNNLKLVKSRRQEQSVHLLCGLHDADAKPIIFCSHQNGTVTIYDLPSFEERGKMFSTNMVGALTFGPNGLVFTGDKSGKLRVWNLAGDKV